MHETEIYATGVGPKGPDLERFPDIKKKKMEHFVQTNSPKICQLKQSISSLKQEESCVSTYFTKMKALWDELNSLKE